MRASAIGLIIALTLVPGAVFAQGAPPPAEQGGPPGAPGAPPPAAAPAPPPAAATAPPPGAITREEFVQRRADAAGRLFDRVDAHHLGYITRAQWRSWVAAHRRWPPSGAAGPQEQ